MRCLIKMNLLLCLLCLQLKAFAFLTLRPQGCLPTRGKLSSISTSLLFSSPISSSSNEGLDREKIFRELVEERNRRKRELAVAEIALSNMEREFRKEDNGHDGKKNIKSKSSTPSSALKLGITNFNNELKALLFNAGRRFEDRMSSKDFSVDAKKIIATLELSNQGVWDREKQRPPIKAPLIIKIPYYFLCALLDTLFDNDPLGRFWFLETVARMPYFSYITLLHTYETLGWWKRSSEIKRVHFAEEMNEFNHLLIMESLGGDVNWSVRFFARHSAFVYFFVLCGLWLISPTLAYNFSELIEAHAVDTYTEFYETNEMKLRILPAPRCAVDYYMNDDLYQFDEFQTALQPGSRRPIVKSLYDVFVNIAEDERSHVATMAECVKGGKRSFEKEVVELSEAAKTILLDIGFVTIVVGIAILGSGGITFDTDLLSLIMNGGNFNLGDIQNSLGSLEFNDISPDEVINGVSEAIGENGGASAISYSMQAFLEKIADFLSKIR